MKELIHFRATIFVESPIGYTKDNVDMFPLKDWKCMPLTNDANTQAMKIVRFAYSPTYGEKNGDFSDILRHPSYKDSDAASDRSSALIARAEIRKERVLDDSSVSCWNIQKIDDEIKTYFIDSEQRDAFMLLFKTRVRKYLGVNLDALGSAVAENLTKISAAMGSIEVKDVWMRHRSDEQMQYIFKLTDHISLEIMSPLMKESEGEFYSVYYDGKCQHMGAATINNIADEMKKLKDYLKE